MPLQSRTCRAWRYLQHPQQSTLILPIQRSAVVTSKPDSDNVEQGGPHLVASNLHEGQQPICQAASAHLQAAPIAEQKATSLPPSANPPCVDKHGINMGQTQHDVNMGQMQCGAGQHSQVAALSNMSSSADTASKPTAARGWSKNGDSSQRQPLQPAVGTGEEEGTAGTSAVDLSQADPGGSFADDWDWQQTQGVCAFHDAYQPSQGFVTEIWKSPVRQGTPEKGLGMSHGKQRMRQRGWSSLELLQNGRACCDYRGLDVLHFSSLLNAASSCEGTVMSQFGPITAQLVCVLIWQIK